MELEINARRFRKKRCARAMRNISFKILGIPIPRFDKDETKNRKVINKVMDDYLKALKEKEQLEKEIREIDEKIDDMVFKLYDFRCLRFRWFLMNSVSILMVSLHGVHCNLNLQRPSSTSSPN